MYLRNGKALSCIAVFVVNDEICTSLACLLRCYTYVGSQMIFYSKTYANSISFVQRYNV